MKKIIVLGGLVAAVIAAAIVGVAVFRLHGDTAGPAVKAPASAGVAPIEFGVSSVPSTGPKEAAVANDLPPAKFDPATDRDLTDAEKVQLSYPVAWHVRLRAGRTLDGKVFPAYVVVDQGADVDGDGLDAAKERELGTDEHLADTDADGLDDGGEVSLGTDPKKPDTDGDGTKDGEEVRMKRDPLDPAK